VGAARVGYQAGVGAEVYDATSAFLQVWKGDLIGEECPAKVDVQDVVPLRVIDVLGQGPTLHAAALTKPSRPPRSLVASAKVASTSSR